MGLGKVCRKDSWNHEPRAEHHGWTPYFLYLFTLVLYKLRNYNMFSLSTHSRIIGKVLCTSSFTPPHLEVDYRQNLPDLEYIFLTWFLHWMCQSFLPEDNHLRKSAPCYYRCYPVWKKYIKSVCLSLSHTNHNMNSRVWQALQNENSQKILKICSQNHYVAALNTYPMQVLNNQMRLTQIYTLSSVLFGRGNHW